MYLYLFPEEALARPEPFLAAGQGPPEAAAAEDLLVLPRGCGPVLPPGNVFVYDCARPERVLPPGGAETDALPAVSCSDTAHGPLEDYLRERLSAAGDRLWIFLPPLRAEYPLPCPRDGGQALTREALDERIAGNPVFYAAPFLCMACALPEAPARLILFDTARTLAEKRSLLRSLGAAHVFQALPAG